MSTASAKPTEYRGHVANGVVVFDEPVPLAEGMEVRVAQASAMAVAVPIGRKLLALAGTVKGMPVDLAENHDHYIHGTPKRTAI